MTSAAILGSISTAVTLLAFSNIFTVRFPVPGPTSRTLSVGLRFAWESCRLLIQWDISDLLLTASTILRPSSVEYLRITWIIYWLLSRCGIFEDMLSETLGIEDRVGHGTRWLARIFLWCGLVRSCKPFRCCSRHCGLEEVGNEKCL